MYASSASPPVRCNQYLKTLKIPEKSKVDVIGINGGHSQIYKVAKKICAFQCLHRSPKLEDYRQITSTQYSLGLM